MSRSRKADELLALIRAGGGEDGIYALASAAGRPYRRVHDQVKKLAAEGHVRLERTSTGTRARIRVRPSSARKPSLSFDRAWSRPSGGLDDDTVIAQVLSRPTFDDLLTCVDHYGLGRVRAVRGAMLAKLELSPMSAAATARMLKNIEIGRARAAGVD